MNENDKRLMEATEAFEHEIRSRIREFCHEHGLEVHTVEFEMNLLSWHSTRPTRLTSIKLELDFDQ